MTRTPADEGLRLTFETRTPTNGRPYYLDMSPLLYTVCILLSEQERVFQ